MLLVLLLLLLLMTADLASTAVVVLLLSFLLLMMVRRLSLGRGQCIVLTCRQCEDDKAATPAPNDKRLPEY